MNEIKLNDTILDETNWKCAGCKRYFDLKTPCVLDDDGKAMNMPSVAYEPSDECIYFQDINEPNPLSIAQQIQIDENLYIPDAATLILPCGIPYYVDIYDNKIIVYAKIGDKKINATVENTEGWGQELIDIAIEKAVISLNDEVEKVKDTIPIVKSETLSENDLNQLREIRTTINSILGEENTSNNLPQETMLEGDTKLGWFEQVTSWKRVLNAARRTIGKDKLDNEPSDSWKAKILLAEHSPIRLLEFDFGWEKIRQWVTAHFVRHHEGVEKFVHSQRGDRRELPCDRDHIFQGAKNDMDASVNAQALISISRKRCCMCASKETREAWQMVLDELKKDNPVLASKCVRECVYRGFCPEWMSKCKYCYSDAYWRELADYRNTIFGKDVKTKQWTDLTITNTGKIYAENGDEIIPIKEDGKLFIQRLDYRLPVAELIYTSFIDEHRSKSVKHKDGNIWNNNVNNLYV